jgi:hypothetical protein
MAEGGRTVKAFARIVGRIAMIALAVALFAGLTTMYARTMRPRVFRARVGRGGRGDWSDLRRRPDNVQFGRFPEIFKEGGLFALVTLAGRKILRLRL